MMTILTRFLKLLEEIHNNGEPVEFSQNFTQKGIGIFWREMWQFQDLLAAMKMLGLNPMEQEIIDLTNNIVRNGYIYFPEFCKVK